MEIRRNEVTNLFAHYDYFTGRAIRIVLNGETRKDLEMACQCIVLAKKLKVRYVGAEAREVAADAYRTLRPVTTDLQLKVLECCATSPPGIVQKALLSLFELELSKMQMEIVT